MSRVTLAKTIKICILIVGILGLIFLSVVVPNIGYSFIIAMPEWTKCFYPWLFLSWAVAIPCYYVLILGWKLTNSLESDEPFTHKNGNLFRNMAWAGFGDAMFFIVMNITYLFLNMNHPMILIISVAIGFVVGILSVCALIFSYLFHKAADLQEQSDFTI